MTKKHVWTSFSALLLLASATDHAAAQDSDAAAASAAPAYSYADLVDLSAAAPVIAKATVTKAIRLKAKDAGMPAAGAARLYVEAKVTTLMKGAGGLAPAISYLVDAPLGRSGKPPKLRKAQMLLFAAPGGGDAGALRLVAPDAQLAWSPELEARVRGIVTAQADPQAPPRITGIGNAFHVPGTLPGEGETQIFLATADGRPVSLAVLRRPQEQPRWAVALSEMVDDAAVPPPRDSLLWYHLACELPRALPATSLDGASRDDAAAARADYQVVLNGLGPCARSRKQD